MSDDQEVLAPLWYKKAIHLWVEKVINSGHLSILDDLVHDDYVYRSPCEERRGLEAIKGFITMFRTAFPDLKLRIDDLVIENDKAVNCFTLTGTHEGEFMGIPATGKQIEVHGVVLSRFEDGKVIEEWEILDEFALFEQLGVISLAT